jgi:hypothetical protein
MIVEDFDIGRTSFPPDEANAPLVVDTDRKPPPHIAPQRFQPIAGRRAKIRENARLIEQTQLSQRRVLDVDWKFATSPTRPDQRRFVVGETLDHILL